MSTSDMGTSDVVIIGAGIAGLASAAIMAANHKKVTLIEATDRAGGYQRRFESEGFSFEPNFHFLQDVGLGRPVRQLLESLGIEQTFNQLDPIARISFPDQVINIPNSRDEFICHLKQLFPEEVAGIDDLFNTMSQIYLAITHQQPSELLLTYGLDNVDSFLERFIQSPRLKAITGCWAAYFGYGSAHIAALAIVVFTESCWDGGIFHLDGGVKSLTDKLLAVIERSGGVVKFNTNVTQIVTQSGAVNGVELSDGAKIKSPLVISAIDTFTTFGDLLDDPLLAEPMLEHILTLPRFRSPFCVYLGVKSESLELGNIAPVCIDFVSDDIEAQDKAQLLGKIDQAPLSLGIPTYFNKDLAPPGHDIVILYTFVSNDLIDTLMEDKSRADHFARQMINRVEAVIPGLKQQIVVMETSASATTMLYNDNTKGALGWSPTAEILPRMPDHDSQIPGLYLVGQWTRTGGGMNNVFASAHLATAMVLSAKE